MSVQAIYDFPTIFEDAMARVLNSRDLVTATPRTAGKLQKTRPRSELYFQLGNEKKSYHIVKGVLRNATWFSQIQLLVLTDAGSGGENGGSPLHRLYRAEVLNAFGDMKDVLNGKDVNGDNVLNCHQVQLITQTGHVVMYKPQQNTEASRVTFSLEFGVKESAWRELDDPPTDVFVQSPSGAQAEVPWFMKLIDLVRNKKVVVTVEDGRIVVNDD